MIKLSDLGLTQAEALMRLYNYAKPQGMGFLHYDPKTMTVEEAQEILDRCKADNRPAYFDYFRGRVMKIEIGDEIKSVAGFERDNGPGSVMAALTGPVLPKAPMTKEQAIKTAMDFAARNPITVSTLTPNEPKQKPGA